MENWHKCNQLKNAWPLDDYLKFFIKKNSEMGKWQIIYEHYADEQEVKMGEAEYEGELLTGLEFPITFCPYCGEKL